MDDVTVLSARRGVSPAERHILTALHWRDEYRKQENQRDGPEVVLLHGFLTGRRDAG